MPSKSEKQRRLFGMVTAYKKGTLGKKYQSEKIKDTAEHISLKDAEEFASSVKPKTRAKQKKS